MKKELHYWFVALIILTSACSKDDKIPKDLRHLMGVNDSHWIIDSVRKTGTTFSGGQNVPYSEVEINPYIFEFHSSSEQVVLVKLDARGKTIDRSPCSFDVVDNDQEARIAYSYSAPNRYDVIQSETNKQHWQMTRAKNPGLLYTYDYYMHRKDPI